MTEKLTIKDLNCGNCTESRIDGDGDRWCSKCEWLFTTDFREDDIIRVGCASHPLALQVLAAPVIEELENMKTLAHKRMNAYLDLGNDGNWQGGKEEAFEEAIKLLKEGVNKP